jgi:hypothetical protein
MAAQVEPALEDNATAILAGLGASVAGHTLVVLGETDYSAQRPSRTWGCYGTARS